MKTAKKKQIVLTSKEHDLVIRALLTHMESSQVILAWSKLGIYGVKDAQKQISSARRLIKKLEGK